MGSNRQNNTGGNLQNPQNKGAESTRYKSRVSSLLGIPEDKSISLVFPPTAPPVGFKYAEYGYSGMSYPTPRFPPDGAIPSVYSEEPKVAEKEITRDELLSMDMKQRDINKSRVDKIGVSDDERRNLSQKAVQPREIEEEAPQKNKATLEPAKKDEITTETGEKADIIPNIVVGNMETHIKSEDNQNNERTYPNKTTQQHIIEPKPYRSEASGKFPEISENKASDNERTDIEIPGVSARKRPLTNESDLKGKIIAEDLSKSETLLDKDSIMETAPEIKRYITAKKFVGKSEETQERESRKPSNVEHSTSIPRKEPHEDDLEIQEKIRHDLPPKASAIEYSYNHIPDRINRGTNGETERLRKTVQELTSRINELQNRLSEKDSQEKPEQEHSVPEESVFIMEKPPDRAGTPHAFWERSYSGRFHLRPLR